MSFIAKKFIELINTYTDDYVDLNTIEKESSENNISDVQESSGFNEKGDYVEKVSYVYKGEKASKKQVNRVVWTLIGFAIILIVFLISCLLELLGLM